MFEFVKVMDETTLFLFSGSSEEWLDCNKLKQTICITNSRCMYEYYDVTMIYYQFDLLDIWPFSSLKIKKIVVLVFRIS